MLHVVKSFRTLRLLFLHAFLVIFITDAAQAQDARLIEQLKSGIPGSLDHDRVNILNDLADEIMKPAPSQLNSRDAMPYVEEALELAESLRYHYGMSRSIQQLITIHNALGNRGQVLRLRTRLTVIPRGTKIEQRHNLTRMMADLHRSESEAEHSQQELARTETELLQTRQEAERIRQEIEELDARDAERLEQLRQQEQTLRAREMQIAERDRALEESAEQLLILEQEREMLAMQNRILEQNTQIHALEAERHQLQNRILWGIISAVTLIIAALLYLYYTIRKTAKELREKNRIIEEEKKRSEELLLNILPLETANELKKTGKATARNYELITVLLTDFKDFTRISEKLGPKELVDEIDLCFSAFDAITGRYGIEKIKTIGDAYLCAHGLPSGTNHNPVNVVKAAQEMVEFMNALTKRRNEQGRPSFSVRIGIHSGPLVAGVVGQKKFAYDIWGDTVNTAARLEQMSEPGRINVSQSTYHLVSNDFEFEHRGKIAAKNKGEIDMYFVKQ